jgi:NADP-dependent 3-hydroxy acid dehydrogenase YdfG
MSRVRHGPRNLLPAAAMDLDPSSVLLTDRIAVVTGAAVGIGAHRAACALRRSPRALRPRRREPRGDSAAARAVGRRVLTDVFDVRDEAARSSLPGRGRADFARGRAGEQRGGGFFAPFWI